MGTRTETPKSTSDVSLVRPSPLAPQNLDRKEDSGSLPSRPRGLEVTVKTSTPSPPSVVQVKNSPQRRGRRKGYIEKTLGTSEFTPSPVLIWFPESL